MSATQKYRTVTTHNGKWVWQRQVLGLPLRSPVHFDSPEDAAIDSCLVAYYFLTTWKITLPLAMENQEHWSCMIYSRRNVALADCQSVEKSMHQCVRDFVAKNLDALTAHRDSQHESLASKYRRSGMIEIPAYREWVERLEAAAKDEKDFSEINHEYFNQLVNAASSRIYDALPPLRKALKMLESASNEKLVNRRIAISALIEHFIADANFVRDFSAQLTQQQTDIASALAKLEAAKPPVIT